ncbi:hypothetical protein TMatcc_009546 [Talaromyces marneffei ATCC 18224]|uniref:Protein rds1 n=1 Tax=Talaromyces marneffei (strain ATCC 18224 / CBS 334.59 / QM 7333) TaxID=441960 RepID=B6QSH6_TALMQ|nr:uncharacterized protein EYB26_008796 [Talaromyces marneffei]EEA19413.1 conserved hypothetical protein [Talaromyces marneffei ATCC 18224]KAE8547733.1 hypothetical protein EYB25_009526 [Talaromyces marneffei]QGA21086.1 hypothetical protein EYB26_008796 [Talaromyces marneffei]
MISAKQAIFAGCILFSTATNVLSFPLTTRQQAISDIDILQFALTLEHLENTFYKQALSKFSQADFTSAGFNEAFLINLEFIAHDEEQHVVLLQSAISQAGAAPVASCQYNFPITDVTSFVNLATVFEGVGVSAYLGAATAISSKAILNVAAAITVSEGLHQAIQRASILDVVSANIAGTPLSPNAIFTIASAFISSCPSTNAPLPFKAFPALSVDNVSNAAQTLIGNTVATLTVAGGTAIPSPAFVTFVSGLDIISVPAQVSGSQVSVTIPQQVSGQAFGLITSVSMNGTGTIFDDTKVIAGPAIMEIQPLKPTIDFTIL